MEYSSPGGFSLKLDAHIPQGNGHFPAVILVHGGGWNAGTKQASFIKPRFPLLDSTGYSWFTIDYRLVPKHPYPAAADDVEAAITFVKKNARKYKVDPKRIAIMGESAGGHLVDLIGARNRQGLVALFILLVSVTLLFEVTLELVREFEEAAHPGEDIAASLREALAWAKGEAVPVRVTRIEPSLSMSAWFDGNFV